MWYMPTFNQANVLANGIAYSKLKIQAFGDYNYLLTIHIHTKKFLRLMAFTLI